ncbi:MAG: hypothetical protein GC182_19805 [Rhodopseudomonas sp.]|nr:hypothetical protein [Rhodopseudomonas sp.]
MTNQPTQPHRDREPEETDSERRTTNIVLVVAAVLVIGGGIWLVNTMIDVNKAQRCLESGRRNCNPISVPPRRLD